MEAKSIEVLPAGSGDELEIAPMMATFNQIEGIVWRPELMIPALRRVLREDQLGLILVARDRASRAAVGYCLATFGYDLEFAGRDAFITELFVASSVQRRGFGQALLDSMVDRLRHCDVHAVHLMVRPENERARSLYESRGFEISPRLMMTKRLDADGSHPLTKSSTSAGNGVDD